MTGFMDRQTRDIVLAFTLSVLIHAGFLLLSGRIQFGGLGYLQSSVEKAFQVQILPEAETRLVRKPRQDVEAERQEQLRRQIRQRQSTLPALPDVPVLEIEGRLREDIGNAFDRNLSQKRATSSEAAAPLPDILSQSSDQDFQLDILEIARAVGRESPSTKRRSATPEKGDLERQAQLAGAVASTLKARLASTPQIAQAPGETLPGGPGAMWRPGLLPPKPIIDLSRNVEQPPQVPPLYITPDEEKINRYVSLDQFLSVELYVYHVPNDPRGYFMVRITPNEKSRQLPAMNKDIVLVLDASASMGGRTLSLLRTGLKLCLSKLHGGDLFNVVGFKRNVLQFRRGLVPATAANVNEAVDFVDGLEHSGRTDIYRSLEPISQLARGGDHPFVLLLFSDGRPTVGVVDSRAIINDLTANVKRNTSVFAFGAGGRVNRYLLDLLSYRNKGYVEFSQDYSLMVDQIETMFNSLSDPLLINLSSDYGNVLREDVYPRMLPDLYRNGEVLVFGRYGRQEKFSLRILGEARGEKKEFVIDLDFPSQDNGPENLPQLWAFRKIYDLIGQMCQEGETPERLEEIHRLSAAYGVKTPYYQ